MQASISETEMRWAEAFLADALWKPSAKHHRTERAAHHTTPTPNQPPSRAPQLCVALLPLLLLFVWPFSCLATRFPAPPRTLSQTPARAAAGGYEPARQSRRRMPPWREISTTQEMRPGMNAQTLPIPSCMRCVLLPAHELTNAASSFADSNKLGLEGRQNFPCVRT